MQGFRFCALMALLCSLEHSAGAQPAIEAHQETRLQAAGPTIARMRTAFERHGATVAPRVVAAAIRDIAKPTVADPTLTYAAWVKHAETAFGAFMRTPEPAKMPPIARELDAVLAEASANPVLFTIEEGSREVLTRMHQAAVLIRHKMGNLAGADAAASELLRSHPDVPPGWLPSEIKVHYDKVLENESLRARGELEIEVNRPDALILINEYSRSRTGRFSGRLFAGTYRVLVRVGEQSLRYDLAVESGKSVKLDLDWSLESTLTVSNEWVGVTLTSNDPDSEELAKVRALSRKMNGASSLVVLRVTATDAAQQASATAYQQISARGGRLARRGRVALTGDQRRDEAKLDALARFVMTGIPSPEVEATTTIRQSDHVATAPTRSTDGVHRQRSPVPMLLIGAGGLALLGGGVLYMLDEDANRFSTNNREIRNTAPLGVAVGVAGIAAIGVGSWLWVRKTRSTPTLAVDQTSAVLGWAGAF